MLAKESLPLNLGGLGAGEGACAAPWEAEKLLISTVLNLGGALGITTPNFKKNL